MYDGRRATRWVSVFYFVSLITLGMMIVMNLFLAILLSNFTNKDDVDAEAGGSDGDRGNAGPPAAAAGSGGGRNAANPRVAPFSPVPNSPSSSASPTAPGSPLPRRGGTTSNPHGGRGGASKGEESETSAITIAVGKKEGSGGGNVVPTAHDVRLAGERSRVELADRGHRSASGKAGWGDGETGGVKGLWFRACGVCCALGRAYRRAGGKLIMSWLDGFQRFRVPDDLDEGRAMIVLGPNNPIRRGCAAVVVNPGFDQVTLVLISVSSIALAMDNPLRDPSSAVAVALHHVEVVMTVLFIIEMAMKICSHGFVAMHGAYLRNSWNVLDFLVVIISLFLLFSSDSDKLKGLRSLRALRAFRPLR